MALRTVLHRRDDDNDAEDVSNKFVLIHGVLMAVSFAILFPLGSIFLHTLRPRSGAAWFHGAWQTVTYMITLAAFGIGVWIADKQDQTLELTADNGHPVIGIIVIAILLLQPFFGAWHHVRFRAGAKPTPIGFIHRWNGRLMLVLGVINGGLGLQLAQEDNNFIIPYSVVAAVLYLLWLVVVLRKNRQTAKVDKS